MSRKCDYKRDEQGNVTAKECTRCNRMLPVARFGVNRREPFGIAAWCRDCTNEYHRAKEQETERLYAMTIKAEIQEQQQLLEKSRAQKRLVHAILDGEPEKPGEATYFVTLRKDFPHGALHMFSSRYRAKIFICMAGCQCGLYKVNNLNPTRQ